MLLNSLCNDYMVYQALKPLMKLPLQQQRMPIVIICPACSDEVTPSKIVERGGYIGCLNCVK